MRILAFTLLFICYPVLCDSHFHPLFSNDAILQRNTPLPVIVYSDKAVSLTLSLDGTAIATADVQHGQWSGPLPPQPAGGPHEIAVTGDGVDLRIHGVYFGDVYLASGQSNMELTMARVEEAYHDDVANADYPLVREYTVPDQYAFNHPLTEPGGAEWKKATAGSIRSLSAVSYYFARKLFRTEGVPIGIVNASLGGSPIEAWMAAELLTDYPDALAEAAPFKEPAFIQQTQRNDQSAAQAWYSELARRDKGLSAASPWYSPTTGYQHWSTFSVPGKPAFAYANFIGSWWASISVNLTSVPADPVILRLGRIREADEVWVNGQQVGNTTYQYPPRRYPIPTGLLKPGNNTITIRITSTDGHTGFIPDKPYYLGNDHERVALSGEWHYRVGATMPNPAPVQTFIRWKPTGLYNAMIAPLTSYPITGVLWYQGESNTASPADYAGKLVTLMSHWRNQWGNPTLPFFIVQLANYMTPQSTVEDSPWAQLRNEQAKAAATPHVYLTTTIDVGEYNDIHPVNKRDVGERLAHQALKAIYHLNVNASGPSLAKATKEDAKVYLTFADPQGLHISPQSPAGFTLAGKDGIFYWADLVHDGNTIVLSSPHVPHPVLVRYAWADNPIYSITDGDSWPLAPFELAL